MKSPTCFCRLPFLLLLLAGLALAALPLAAQGAAGNPKEKLKTREQILRDGLVKRPPPPTIVERYLATWLQIFPTEAAARGDHSQSANLEDLPPRRLLSWLKYNKTLAGEINRRLADPEIQGDERLDLQVLREQVRLEILTYDSLKRHQQDPLYWTSILSQATVFQLVREDRPAAERLEGAARRAEKMGILASQVIASLAAGDPDQMSPESVDAAIETLRPLAEFYRQGFVKAAEQLPAGAQRQKMATRLGTSGNAAANAIEALLPFFDRLKEKARGNPRLEGAYGPYFRAVTGLAESPQRVAERATRALAAKRGEAAELCRSIWPRHFAGTPAAPAAAAPEDENELLRLCFSRVEQDRAKNVDEFVADYRQLVVKAEAFVRQKGFFTLPPKLEVRTERSPAFLGGAAVGGIYPPGPYAPDAPSLLFLPTPPADLPPEQLAAFFQDFNHHFNVMITPHETVPGHAAQMTLAARLPSKVRAIFPNGSYVEGWATFVERIMLDQGWGGELDRVAHLKKQLENIARTVVDISVHTQGWSEEQATAFIRDQALQKEQFAGNMWTRTLRTPAQITTYWIGYQQIFDLFEEARAKKGDQFQLKAFLDGMMQLGPVPVSHYRRVIFPPPPPTPAATSSAEPTATPAGG